jgi:poly(3-hydroxybutyrate) depolymerase
VVTRIWLCAALAVAVGCGGDDDVARPSAVAADDCIVVLHGKGGEGADPVVDGGVAVLAPEGNGEGWGGREWRYANDTDLTAALDRVRRTVDDAACERVVLNGFSNGAAFAAALVCSGDTLDGRLAGVVIDDPVTDAATVGCSRDPDVPVVVYWTGALDADAPPGTDCASIGWTCAGGSVRGVDEFAADLGVAVTASPFSEHRPYTDAPEPAAWLT